MATVEGENTTNPTATDGPDGALLLPTLAGENTARAAGATNMATVPRVSIDSRAGIVRRSGTLPT